ncbi:MAG: hypothetical protein PVG99_12285, partial [Desulfobacteraceae bacterium]
MKIAIAGAGTTGAYLYRLLTNEGFRVDLYDRKRKTACGINPCAWGTSRGFAQLLKAARLDPEKYILEHCDHFAMDDVLLRGDLMTFDKPEVVKDLLQGADI